MSIKEIPADRLIEKASEKLKTRPEFKPPEWAEYVKTGTHKERPPQNPDWWWIRTAAVLRKISINGSIGVTRLRKVYGGRKNKGHKPEHKYKASGSVLRKILQQLETAEYVSKSKNDGRKITPKGSSFLSEIEKGVRKDKK